MTIHDLDQLFMTTTRRDALKGVVALAKKHKPVQLTGLAGSAAAMALSALPSLTRKPVLVVGDSLDDAGYLCHDLIKLLGEEAVAVFPSGYKRDIKYGQEDPPSQILRIEALNRLSDQSGKLKVVVACPEALAERVASADTLSEHTLRLAMGEEIDLDQTQRWLRDNGFVEVD